jgi:hypothetical protein
MTFRMRALRAAGFVLAGMLAVYSAITKDANIKP